MDFITWWFDKHYILSSITMPCFSLVWAIYYGLVIRGIVCALFVFVLISGQMISSIVKYFTK